MPSINIKAVVIGTVIDVGGSLLAGLLFTVVYTVMLLAEGVSRADVQQRMVTDPSFYVVSVILGLGFLAGGALVAARMARAREVLHAGLVGVVAIATGLFFVLAGDTTMWPSWYIPVSFGLTLPVALLTGYVARRRAPAPQTFIRQFIWYGEYPGRRALMLARVDLFAAPHHPTTTPRACRAAPHLPAWWLPTVNFPTRGRARPSCRARRARGSVPSASSNMRLKLTGAYRFSGTGVLCPGGHGLSSTTLAPAGGSPAA